MRTTRPFFLTMFAVLFLTAFANAVSPIPGCFEQSGPDTHGSVYLICPAANPNADLVIFAHGFVQPSAPIGIPYDQLVLPDGTSIPALIRLLGLSFAATSYPTNGLAITQGVDDVKNLATYFNNVVGKPGKTYLVGVSEGGLVTAKALETSPDVFTGGIAACGPIGDFNYQISYFMDARVVFDYFFPGVIPGSPINIPDEVQQDFLSCTSAGCFVPYAAQIKAALDANPSKRTQLLNVTHIPTGPDPDQSILDVLWYNAVATNDAFAKLGGNPYDNHAKLYFGSSNDLALNLKIQRFKADAVALVAIANGYQTTGKLSVPMITLHTTGDNVVPYLHELIYIGKSAQQKSLNNLVPLPVLRYGHCNFTPVDAVIGLWSLFLKTSQ